VELADWQKWWKREGRDELNALLLKEWNPIGVEDLPEDEYSSYAGQLALLLREGAPESDIAAYLSRVSTETIGMRPAPEGDRRFASRAIAWYADAMKRAS
jgi:hypothetical protein